MALGRDIVDAIIQEHAYRPITGDVCLIGHQTVNLSADEILELMHEHGVGGAASRKAAADDGMSAVTFFELLGINSVRNVAVENADAGNELPALIPQSSKSAQTSLSTAVRFLTYFLRQLQCKVMPLCSAQAVVSSQSII